jgi:hypothetical protein
MGKLFSLSVADNGGNREGDVVTWACNDMAFTVTTSRPFRARCSITLIVFLLLFPSFAVEAPAGTFEEEVSAPLTPSFSVGAKIRYLFKSYTSYEFGDPYFPYQEQLSRLEFPLDTWWAGLDMRLRFRRFSVGLEALTSVKQNAHGEAEDSDWESGPDDKTTYSTSQMRVAPSYMVRFDADLEVSDWLGLPGWLKIRPLGGIRYQRFNLVNHDGIQYDLTGASGNTLLPGEGIRFKQTYWHYFVGLRSTIALSRPTGIPSLTLNLQADWAYVEGMNEDNHLQRAGRRFTYEDTYGEAWHFSMGLKKELGKGFSMGLDGDYLTLSTTGNHRLLNRTFGMDMSFSNGVRVWSDQLSLSLTLEYRF